MKKTIFFLLLFVINLFPQTNLLENPGFEDSVNVGWWLNAWGGTQANLYNETDEPISGNISAGVEVTTPDAENIAKVSLMCEPLTNIPDGELVLKAYAKTKVQQYLPFKLSVKCRAADGSTKWYGGDEVYLTTAPQEVIFVVNPDENYRDTIWVRLSCGKKVGTYIFDDVVFTTSQSDTIPVPEGRRLREIVADFSDDNFYVGGAMQSNYWNSPSEEILYREFNYVTPANDFKQTYIHPEPGVYRWQDAENWLPRAREHNMVMRMHSPIGPQCSQWAKDDSRTPEELLQNLEEYVTALCQHFNDDNDVIKWMDVVNETIDANTGEWFGPKPGTDSWENPWTIIGFDTTVALRPPLYIKRAFELANQYAPNIKQIINQHGSMNDAAWDKVKALVAYLRDQGLRVDGIGFQGHVKAGWEFESNDSGVNNLVALGNLIDWAHENDLEFHITENNVFLQGADIGNWEKQAATFKAIVETALAHRAGGLVTWDVWMIRDCDGQAASKTPVLFRCDGSAKPAYYAVQDALENAPDDVEDNINGEPVAFELLQNYPNPFNPTTTISYTIPNVETQNFASLQLVTLKVYDVLGREVATLVNEVQPAGNYAVTFDASKLPSGTYFYRLQAGKYSAVKKMMLIK